VKDYGLIPVKEDNYFWKKEKLKYQKKEEKTKILDC